MVIGGLIVIVRAIFFLVEPEGNFAARAIMKSRYSYDWRLIPMRFPADIIDVVRDRFRRSPVYLVTVVAACLYLLIGHLLVTAGTGENPAHRLQHAPVSATVRAILPAADGGAGNGADQGKHAAPASGSTDSAVADGTGSAEDSGMDSPAAAGAPDQGQASRSPGGFDGMGIAVHTIRFKAELREGVHAGDEVTAVQALGGNYAALRKVAVGDKVLVMEPGSPGQGNWEYVEHQRSHILAWIAVLFALAVLLYGGRKGFRTLLSLLFCIGAIFYVFVPAILAGRNIYFWTFLTCTMIVGVNLLLVNGAGKKTLATALGCLGGVLVATCCSLAADSFLHLTGIIDEDSIYLLYLNKDNPIDLRAIVFSAILIGALGAIMDVAMDIASALHEMKASNRNLSSYSLWQAGNSIGRDIFGMMSNTLVLVYIGGSLTLVLLYASFTPSWSALLNREMVVVEVLQAIIGSFGILFAIPFTSFVCAVLYSLRRRRRGEAVAAVEGTAADSAATGSAMEGNPASDNETGANPAADSSEADRTMAGHLEPGKSGAADANPEADDETANSDSEKP